MNEFDSREDTHFRLSKTADRALRGEARAVGKSLRATFRIKASRLTKCSRPVFNVSGEALTEVHSVGLHPELAEKLHAMCDRLGVPRDCAGELVAAWTPHEGFHLDREAA